ncbi:MAG: hypothetical protein QOD98_1776 [Nocardioidaceae bacterium]|nr:hypothetical protein [Nocardioidaceae bacterium]
MAERSSDLWASFPHDPRDPAVAPLRASDADRNVVHGILTDAFADGRLDREEYDERTAATLQARTLGQFPALVADLVPDRPLRPGRLPLATASTAEIQTRAEEQWRDDRRGAFLGFVGSAVVTWAIWLATAWGDWNVFPWPLIVNAVAFMNFVRVAANRRELVAREVRSLERKQARELEARNQKDQSGQ